MRTFRLHKFVLDRPAGLSGENRVARKSGPFRVIVGPAKTIAGTNRVKRRRISWHESSSPDVAGYRMYWAVNESVGYDSHFADVGRVTAVLLPDEVPSFPRIKGRVEIGITAVSRSGNESDMCILAASFDFIRPEMPVKVKIETMKEQGI